MKISYLIKIINVYDFLEATDILTFLQINLSRILYEIETHINTFLFIEKLIQGSVTCLKRDN